MIEIKEGVRNKMHPFPTSSPPLSDQFSNRVVKVKISLLGCRRSEGTIMVI